MKDDKPSPDDQCSKNLCCFCLFFLGGIVGSSYIFILLFTDPYSPIIRVNHASFNEFNFTADGHTLRYNLHLNITALNPNINYDVHYDDVRVKALWSSETVTSSDGGRRLIVKNMFAAANLNSFYQGKGVITSLPPLSLKGKHLIITGEDHSYMLTHASNPNPRRMLLRGSDTRVLTLATNDDHHINSIASVLADGQVYEIFVEVSFRNKFRRLKSPESWEGGFIRSHEDESTFSCDLLVPLIKGSQSASASISAFRTIQCD